MASVVGAGQATVKLLVVILYICFSISNGSGLDDFQIPQHRKALFVMCKLVSPPDKNQIFHLNFKQFFYFDKSKLTFGGFLLLASAFAFSWIELSKPKVKTANDLYFINGHFRDYNFSKNGGRYTTYTFRLKEFSNSFKIKADFLGDFDINKFKTIDYGDDLKVSISKDDIKNLNTDDSYFFVFSIINNETTFLSADYTIKKHNSYFIYYAAAGFTILGFISIYFGQKWKRIRDKPQLVD